MSIIRFNTEEVFGVDSQEYEILVNAAKQVKIPGIIAEIGTRRGGSAKMIMDALVETGENYNRPFVCIDPYGNIEIECTNLNMSVHYPGTYVSGDPMSKEITSPHRFDYTNDMRNRIIPSLYYYAYSQGFDFRFFQLEDTEYIVRYSDGIPFYNNNKIIENTYAFVFFDGPHDNDSLMLETAFFINRSTIGSVFVYDDEWMYDHSKIETELFCNGFTLLEKGKIKASYIKVS